MVEKTEAYVRAGGDLAEPTPDELDRIEKAAALDDDIPSVNTAHAAPDNDPYGWIAGVEAVGWTAGVEAAHPGFVDTSNVRPVEIPHVIVWQHAMIDPQRFDHAVAKVLPNGTLLVTPRGSDVPLKGYAPGVWVTFEHVGPEYHAKPQMLRMLHDDRLHMEDAARYAVDHLLDTDRRRPPAAARVDVTSDMDGGRKKFLTDPVRRTPPTHEQDADDTQTIPTVQSVSQADEAGGGVGPKARGVREDAASTGPTLRPRTGAPETDERTPGRLRSLWHALRNPDWAED